MTPPLATAWGIIPHFPSSSISRTIEFYTKKLHFHLGGIDPEGSESEAYFCSLYAGTPPIRSNIYFFLKKAEDDFHPVRAMIALGTKAVDEYYEALKVAGEVEIVDEIKDQPWGYRQFTIRDPDGNQLQFFRFIEGGNPGDE